jgi:acyl-CoA thioesterase FadM
VSPAPSAPAPGQGITVRYRPRFDECRPDGHVRTSALLRYAQDIAWIHSERLGFDRRWYAERDLAWVVRAMELELLSPLELGMTLDLSTAVIGLRKVWARRRSEGRIADGTLVLWGHTDWVMTDTRRGLPARVPDAFPATFEAPPGSFEPGRVRLPVSPSDAIRHEAPVRPQDLDPMGHVNNAVYVDLLEEALAAAGPAAAGALDGLPRHIRLEYLAPAVPGARLTGEVWPDAGEGPELPPEWAWRLADDAGQELARARVTTGD